MAATVKHLKQFEKIFLGIRDNADEKLAQLKSEFLDHQEWLRKAVVDTKESKDGLGLVCPATVRKAKTASSRLAQKDDTDKENVDNGGKTLRTKRSIKSSAAKSVNGDNDLDVFDPENDQHMQQLPSKVMKTTSKTKTNSNKDTVAMADREKELSKLKVVDLKEELQKRSLPYAGKKDELVARLASAMEEEEARGAAKQTVEMVVGKDVSPYVGMRVRHVSGKDHRSSKGLLGTIEIIPGRGALKPEERSVSVRWDADKSDVRGPYYTGEPCDRGSGVGTEKFDLITLQEVEEEQAAEEDEDDAEAVFVEAAAGEQEPHASTACIEGLQANEQATEQQADEEFVADDAPGAAVDQEVEEQQRLPSPVSTSNEKNVRKLSGSKRTKDGDIKVAEPVVLAEEALQVSEASPGATASVQALQQRLNHCKKAWTQRMSSEAQSPTAASAKVLRTPVNTGAGGRSASTCMPEDGEGADEVSRPVTRGSSSKKAAVPAIASIATPAKEVAAAEKNSSNKKARGMPAAVEPGVTLCSSAKKAAQPVGPSSQPHESVQHFRAIISRINAEKAASDFSGLPPRSSTSRMPSATCSSAAVASAREEAASSKAVTWPPPPLKATGIKVAEGVETKSGRLTEERLSAHIKSEGKHSMLQSFANSPAVTVAGGGSSRGVGREASSESVHDGSKTGVQRGGVMDAAARQQRAAENRAKLEADMKQKALEQEKRRKELEHKRLEAERIAKERRDREAKEVQDRLDAAKRRAQEDEERRARAHQEQEERKQRERERAEQLERERQQQERERQAKEQERAAKEVSEAAAAAAAAAAKKPSGPSFAGPSSKSVTSSGTGLFSGIGSLFKGVLGTPGTGDAAPPAPAASAGLASLKQKEPADQGPTSIKIIESKNSDDSDSDDEDKKQPVPVWAQSPNLRRQLQRQIDVSPTPVFGECKKTCDLAAMFVNHQPKRRRYDKRTSSANWGDDGGASFMAEQRFEQQIKLNIAMQNDNP